MHKKENQTETAEGSNGVKQDAEQQPFSRQGVSFVSCLNKSYTSPLRYRRYKTSGSMLQAHRP